MIAQAGKEKGGMGSPKKGGGGDVGSGKGKEKDALMLPGTQGMDISAVLSVEGKDEVYVSVTSVQVLASGWSCIASSKSNGADHSR